MTDINEYIKEKFPDQLNCAQTVLTIMNNKYNLQISNPEYLVAGFGGGIGVQGELCGAFSGAIIAISALVSRDEKDVLEHKKKSYKLTAEFLKKIKETYSTVLCNDLLGYDISNNELREKNRPLFKEECPKFITKSLEILFEMFPE